MHTIEAIKRANKAAGHFFFELAALQPGRESRVSFWSDCARAKTLRES